MSVRKFLGLIGIPFAVSSACVEPPTALSESEQREITLVVVSDFLHGLHAGDFPTIYVSDEFLQFTLDTVFISRLSSQGTTFRIGRREEVAVSYDIMPDRTLLLEPCAIQSSGLRAAQCLSFVATSDYGGQYQYELHHDVFGRWTVISRSIVWIA